MAIGEILIKRFTLTEDIKMMDFLATFIEMLMIIQIIEDPSDRDSQNLNA